MKQMILTQFPWMWLSSMGLVIFFTFFVILIFRLNTQNQKQLHQFAQELPLQDGEKYER